MHKKIIWIVFLILLAVPESALAYRSYRVTYSFTPSQYEENGYWIPVARPWNGVPGFDAETVSFSPASGTEVELVNGAGAIHWPASERGYKLSVTFDVEVGQQQVGGYPPSDGQRYEYDYNTSDPSYQAFIGPSPWAQSDDILISATADSIIGNETCRLRQAIALWKWVMDNMTYADNVSQDAVTALTGLKGDCASYANLFVAMCRAVGMPAHIESGFVPLTAEGGNDFQFTDGTWKVTDSSRRFATHVWAWVQIPTNDPDSPIAYKVNTNMAFDDPCEAITLGRGDQIVLGSVSRPWLHLPYGFRQVQDSSVEVSIEYLGTSGIEHPRPETSVPMVGAMNLLLGN